MENLKELKEQYEEMKKDGKLVVEVVQNKKIVNYWVDEKTNLLQLLAFLYNKTVIKSQIRLDYSYNYSDVQHLTFSQSYTNYDGSKTITKYNFYNIPTNLGYIDIYKLQKQMEATDETR